MKLIKSTVFTVASLVLASQVWAKDLSAQEKLIVGKWESAKAEGGALPGKIYLKADKSAKLEPEGQVSLEGTWKVADKNTLIFEMQPYGTSSIKYEIKKNVLTLTYENGVKQPFNKTETTK